MKEIWRGGADLADTQLGRCMKKLNPRLRSEVKGNDGMKCPPAIVCMKGPLGGVWGGGEGGVGMRVARKRKILAHLSKRGRLILQIRKKVAIIA